MKVEEKFIEILNNKKEELSSLLNTEADVKRFQCANEVEKLWLIDYIYGAFEN